MNYAKEQIAKLVIDYSKNGQIADESFINQVITLLVNAYDVNDFVINTEFGLDKDLIGGYDIFSRTIYIDMEKLIYYINYKLNIEKNNGVNNTDYEVLLKCNFHFVNTIAHEINHALQYKKIYLNDNDLETDLLKLSFESNLIIFSSFSNNGILTESEETYIKKVSKLSDDLVYISALPSERMAYINSYRLENEISCVDKDLDIIRNYANVNYKMETIRGYYNGNCPTAYIMSSHNKARNESGLATKAEESIKNNTKRCIKIANQRNLNLDERLYYGLYVSNKELIPVREEIDALTKKLINNS